MNQNSEETVAHYQRSIDSPLSFPGSVEYPEVLDSPDRYRTEICDNSKRSSNPTIIGQSPNSSPIISIAPSFNRNHRIRKSEQFDHPDERPELTEPNDTLQSPILQDTKSHDSQNQNEQDICKDSFSAATPKCNSSYSETTKNGNTNRVDKLKFDSVFSRTDSLITAADSDHPSSPTTNPLMSPSLKMSSNQVAMFEAKPYVPKQKITRTNSKRSAKVNHCLHFLICCIFPLWLFVWIYLILSYEPSQKYTEKDEYVC
ncbi:hypothetical protein TrispH2_007872 [Trichoplax sp. H2]|uniref:Uncharacterized protein n=1 Tax=Trichoplax adhaerens TaxID=10228 RepID=B3RTI0_TRIAD|nr:predicted protein [Trichoplax adhaerens]EDV25632.1 predicted protein [Trichoplax adhaerens]RDD40829.1 hypothetical protein TrispH2_007872 [Trichoplax sp. H2]|eukprot:XP_002111665.1 predicted protein [Trichoplax adhaerens]